MVGVSKIRIVAHQALTLLVLGACLGLRPIPLLAKDASNEAIDRAHSLVEAHLKDPSSVQYRGVKYVPAAHAVCGQYNAKNSFGGYVGFRIFMVDDAGLHLLLMPSDVEAENRRTGEGEANIAARARADLALMRAACTQRTDQP